MANELVNSFYHVCGSFADLSVATTCHISTLFVRMWPPTYSASHFTKNEYGKLDKLGKTDRILQNIQMLSWK